MRNIFLIGLFCLSNFCLNAQEIWEVPAYTQHVELSIPDNEKAVTIVSGDIVTTFSILINGTSVKLKNAVDNQKIIDLLKIEGTVINERYKDMPSNLLPVEKLLTKVYTQPGRKLLITNDGAAVDSYDNVIDGGQETAGGIAGGEEQSSGKEEQNISWTYFIISGLILIIVTAFITRALTRLSQNKLQGVVMEEGGVTNDPGVQNPDIKKMKQQLVDLKQQLQQLTMEKGETDKQLAAFQAFDKNYFNESFHKLVAPMAAAIESGTQVQIIENMMKMAAHYASLTRYKISKKQSYDEANIRYMLDQKLPSDIAVSEITATTPLDKTPKNIQVLIDILKHYKSSGLDDSIISGYKIKNL